MRTELTRHIFDGGVLNDDGSDIPSRCVLREGESCKSFQVLLGKEDTSVFIGTMDLQDWTKTNGKRNVKREYPIEVHEGIGIPRELMRTCRKIQTKIGPLYRCGGFYIEGNYSHQLYILVQIYKDPNGYSCVLAKILSHSAEKEDVFLREMRIKVFKRSGRLVLLESLNVLIRVPLLHLCIEEEPVSLNLGEFDHTVSEKRRQVVKNDLSFQCLSSSGKFFIVNVLALSVKVCSIFSGVWR